MPIVDRLPASFAHQRPIVRMGEMERFRGNSRVGTFASSFRASMMYKRSMGEGVQMNVEVKLAGADPFDTAVELLGYLKTCKAEHDSSYTGAIRRSKLLDYAARFFPGLATASLIPDGKTGTAELEAFAQKTGLKARTLALGAQFIGLLEAAQEGKKIIGKKTVDVVQYEVTWTPAKENSRYPEAKVKFLTRYSEKALRSALDHLSDDLIKGTLLTVAATGPVYLEQTYWRCKDGDEKAKGAEFEGEPTPEECMLTKLNEKWGTVDNPNPVSFRRDVFYGPDGTVLASFETGISQQFRPPKPAK